jgi:CO/xanthine dehydrogenase Mo-binding subunit
MQYTQKRHKMDHRFDAAIDPNGKIQAFKARIYLDGGAYRSWGKEIASKSAVMCTGPYEIPRVWVDTYRAYTNNPLCGAIRGFGTANTLAGTERFWHDVAEKAGIDQLAFRRSNSFVRGSYTSTMHHLPKGVVSVECIDAANKVFEWTKELPPNEGPWRHGKGIATMWYGNGFGRGVPDEGHPIIEVNTDGSVLIRASTVDYGQGSNTVFQMVVSEVTGIPIDKINLLTADTVNTPNCGSTVASRVTVVVGKAVEYTAIAIRDQMLEVAAQLLECEPGAIEVVPGHFRVKESPSRSVRYEDICRKNGKMFTAQVPKLNQEFTSPLLPPRGEGKAYWPYVFGTHLVRVAVNVKSGKIKILDYTAAHDVGKVINPQAARGQIAGGVSMGVGYGISENLVIEEGVVKSDNYNTYRMPMTDLVPDINVVLVEDAEISGDRDFGPTGAKGIGEPPTIPAAPALVNAINDALKEYGIRFNKFPVLAEHIKAALKGIA